VDIVAKAPPDGYTLLMGHVNSHGIAPNIFKKLPYDAERDFAMVAYVGYVPNVLVIHPSIPARSVKELIALAKARPGTLNYAPEQFAAFLRSEIVKYAKLVKAANVTID
jgi:tripartite-type tricarboxylate transporter receptor subunit TctC